MCCRHLTVVDTIIMFCSALACLSCAYFSAIRFIPEHFCLATWGMDGGWMLHVEIDLCMAFSVNCNVMMGRNSATPVQLK